MDTFEQILINNGLYHIHSKLLKHGYNSLDSLLTITLDDMLRMGIFNQTDRSNLLKIIEEHENKTVEKDLLTSNEKIIVCIRKRPIDDPNDDAIDMKDHEIIVNEPKLKVDLQSYTEKHTFCFDKVFDKNVSNLNVYKEGVLPIINHVRNNGTGSIIAYGQTGTGKTYTMMEDDTSLIYKSLKDLIEYKKSGVITFCEIYLGNIYDLLRSREKIILREVSGVVHLTYASKMEFNSYDDACKIIKKGLNNRKTGVTGANLKSSRSHAVIIVNFDKSTRNAISSKNSLIFVDLAGSERGNDRKASSVETKNEGAEINKSLLALKECIRGLEQDKKHLPFRQSKLTQILKNSFVGESKTCIIATISPSFDNIEHTLNTLRYASRIKDFKKLETASPMKDTSFLTSSYISSEANSSVLTSSSLFFSPTFNISEEIEQRERNFNLNHDLLECRTKVKNKLTHLISQVDKMNMEEIVELTKKLDDMTRYIER